MSPKVLVILTSHGPSDTANGEVYGWFLPELAHPYETWVAAGVEVTMVSPKGGMTFVSQDSIKMYADDKSCSDFLKTNNAWKDTAKVDSFIGRASDFDAVFVPGGVGPVYDLADESSVQQLIAEFYDNGKVVSAICHGQAALINVILSDGSKLLANKQMTAFPEKDEDLAKTGHLFPFRLESKLREVDGVRFEIAAEPLGEKVVADGRLVTGQNPASAKGLANTVLSML